MPPRRLLAPFLLLVGLRSARAALSAGVTFTEPILRSIPVVTGSVDAPVPSVTGRAPVLEEEEGGAGQEKSNRGPAGRALYTNDGHDSGLNDGHISPHNWQDLDGGVFPQRNEQYPE